MTRDEWLRMIRVTTLAQMQIFADEGRVTQDQWDEYRYEWRNSTARFSHACARFEDPKYRPGRWREWQKEKECQA